MQAKFDLNRSLENSKTAKFTKIAILVLMLTAVGVVVVVLSKPGHNKVWGIETNIVKDSVPTNPQQVKTNDDHSVNINTVEGDAIFGDKRINSNNSSNEIEKKR